jgi:iron complex outermembrane receptor protein
MSAASKRFATADNSTFLDGYPLVNLVAETSLLWHKVNFRIQGRVNNLSDSFYLNVMNNAMPGRSFAIGLLISYEDH